MKYLSIFVALIAAMTIVALSITWDSGSNGIAAEGDGEEPAAGAVEVRKVSIGKATGANKNEEISKIKTNVNGKLTLEVKNNTNAAASDLHFKITKPQGAKISSISPAFPFDIIVTTLPATEVEIKRKDIGGTDVGDGESQSCPMVIVDKDNNILDKKNVTFQVWWTSGGETVVSYSPNKVGNGVMLAGSVDDFTEEGILINHGDSEFVAPPMAIAEAGYGHRFETGELLIKLERSVLSFDNSLGELSVSAIGEDGEAADPLEISFGTPRIDSAGNIVVPVTRNPGAEEAVAIIVRDAKVVGADDLNSDEEITISMRCSALQGRVLDGWQKIASVTTEEVID